MVASEGSTKVVPFRCETNSSEQMDSSLLFSQRESVVDSTTRVVKVNSSKSQNNTNNKYIDTSSEDE